MKKNNKQPRQKPYRKKVLRKTATGFSVDGRNVVVEHRRPGPVLASGILPLLVEDNITTNGA